MLTGYTGQSNVDVPISETGLDSLAVTELFNRLECMVSPLPSSLTPFHDYSARQIAAAVVETQRPSSGKLVASAPRNDADMHLSALDGRMHEAVAAPAVAHVLPDELERKRRMSLSQCTVAASIFPCLSRAKRGERGPGPTMLNRSLPGLYDYTPAAFSLIFDGMGRPVNLLIDDLIMHTERDEYATEIFVFFRQTLREAGMCNWDWDTLEHSDGIPFAVHAAVCIMLHALTMKQLFCHKAFIPMTRFADVCVSATGHSIGFLSAALLAASYQDDVMFSRKLKRVLTFLVGMANAGELIAHDNITVRWESRRRLETLISHCAGVELSIVNSPTDYVLTGQPAAIERVVRRLKAKDVFFVYLPMKFPVHCSQLINIRLWAEQQFRVENLFETDSACTLISPDTLTRAVDVGAAVIRVITTEKLDWPGTLRAIQQTNPTQIIYIGSFDVSRWFAWDTCQQYLFKISDGSLHCSRLPPTLSRMTPPYRVKRNRSASTLPSQHLTSICEAIDLLKRSQFSGTQDEDKHLLKVVLFAWGLFDALNAVENDTIEELMHIQHKIQTTCIDSRPLFEFLFLHDASANYKRWLQRRGLEHNATAIVIYSEEVCCTLQPPASLDFTSSFSTVASVPR